MDVRLKYFTENKIKHFLIESDFNLEFNKFKRFYYSFARPLLPLFVRHYLQNRYTKNIQYNKNFIWVELVDFLKQNSEEWNKFINSLYPDNYSAAIVLTHDVETQKGFDFIPKIIELEKKHQFKSSWNIVPYKYKIHEDILTEIKNAGHEIGIHGYNHDGKLYFSEKIFKARVPYINEAIKKYNAVGFRSPQVHRNLKWLQQLDILYDASCFDYDPFQPFPGGTGSIWPFKSGKFIELPYTLPQDHVLFYTLKLKNINIWKNKTDWLIKNHGTILALTHPDYLLEKDNLKYYEELLTYLSEIKNTWKCLPKEIAEYYKKNILT
ncbi:MAG: polysaccharide deacetylase family protein [Bacteroidales bacterium]|nr:polysaccharide deacetylase family protein [Bacteroidales bacterium]